MDNNCKMICYLICISFLLGIALMSTSYTCEIYPAEKCLDNKVKNDLKVSGNALLLTSAILAVLCFLYMSKDKLGFGFFGKSSNKVKPFDFY